MAPLRELQFPAKLRWLGLLQVSQLTETDSDDHAKGAKELRRTLVCFSTTRTHNHLVLVLKP